MLQWEKELPRVRQKEDTVKNASRREKLIWVVLIALPLVAGIFALGALPPGVHQIPSHWDFSGNITGYMDPAGMLGFGAIMAATNGLMAFFYFCSDQMYDMGLVHGVSKANAPKVLLGTGVFLVLLTVGIYAAMLNAVL